MSSTNSVLNDIKKLLGIVPEYEHFDTDILIHINSSMFTMYQLGYNYDPVTNTTKRTHVNEDTTWAELLDGKTDLDIIKTLLYMKVRLLFDSPTNSFTIEAMRNIIKEYEWRLNVEVDPGVKNEQG